MSSPAKTGEARAKNAMLPKASHQRGNKFFRVFPRKGLNQPREKRLTLIKILRYITVFKYSSKTGRKK
jgi:hypothetical protein